ncbi:MAG: hypothetical protein JNL79_00045 [Myxococcales bacterium]|nr:hypothetical protein [Myxococcales bacterium]
MPRLHVSELRGLDVTRIGGPALRGNAGARASFEVPLEATLTVAPLVGEAIALGAFQRAKSTIDLPRLDGSGISLVRRATGGPALRVGRGQVHVTLALTNPAVLGGVADPNRALNRQVRPLLRALDALGNQPTTFGGRDIVLMGAAPIAWVGIGHVRSTGATTIEAIVALSRSFELAAELDLAHGAIAPRFLGRTPSTLEAVLGRAIDPDAVVGAIVAAYALQAEDSVATEAPASLPMTRVDADEPPFTAMIEEAIGLLGARRSVEGRVELGGDLFASTDALAALGDALATLDADEAAAHATIEAALEGALLLGVRDVGAFARLARAV